MAQAHPSNAGPRSLNAPPVVPLPLTPLRARLLGEEGPGPLLSLCVDAYADGASREQVVALLEHYPTRLGRRWSTRSHTLDTEWRLATAHVNARRSLIRHQLESFSQAIRQPFTGRSGGVDLAMLCGIERLCLRHGRLPVAVPLATLALEAGVAVTTARRSLRRLLADGWLTQVSAGTRGRAAMYDIGPLPAHLAARTPSVPEHGDLGCDAARERALGKHAIRLWHALADEPLTGAELARQFGYNPNSTRRWLARLAEVGLAERTDGGWRRGPASLEDAARAHATDGTRQRVQAHLRVSQLSRNVTRRPTAVT